MGTGIFKLAYDDGKKSEVKPQGLLFDSVQEC
jgi:hypothetical protein